MTTAILAFCMLYYGAAVLWYWLPLLAVWRRSPPELPPDPAAGDPKPFLIAIAPSRHGAAAIPGMAACVRKQDYPPDRYRLIILIDSDSDSDPSAQIALAAGAEVYERRNAAIRTKGGAINELLSSRLKNEAWDAVMIFDIDARIGPHYFTRVAAYLNRGEQVIQAAPQSKDVEETPVGRISHSGQLLSQLVQRGRSTLGLSAVLSGACMVLRREALEKLRWQTSTGRNLSDDGELNFRCCLAELRVSYAPDLQLLNDMPADIREVRLQRRRWFTAYVEGLPYIAPLLWHGMHGNPKTIEGLYSLMFLPGSSLSFVLAAAGALALGIWSLQDRALTGWFAALAGLWLVHLLYYVMALRRVAGGLSWREFKSLPGFLGTRARSLLDGMILGLRRNPGAHSIPARPKDDADPTV